MKNLSFKNILRPNLDEDNESNVPQGITTKVEEPKATSTHPTFSSSTFKNDHSRFDSRNSIFTNNGSNVKIAEPKTLEDAEVIASAIKEGVVVLLFLDSVTESATASRILDFINGYCHAINVAPQETKQTNLWLYDPKNTKKVTR